MQIGRRLLQNRWLDGKERTPRNKKEYQSQNVPALLQVDEMRGVDAAKKIIQFASNFTNIQTYTEFSERKSQSSCCKEVSMSLLLTAASELRLKNDDCAESG